MKLSSEIGERKNQTKSGNTGSVQIVGSKEYCQLRGDVSKHSLLITLFSLTNLRRNLASELLTLLSYDRTRNKVIR